MYPAKKCKNAKKKKNEDKRKKKKAVWEAADYRLAAATRRYVYQMSLIPQLKHP